MKTSTSYLGLHALSMLRSIVSQWWSLDLGLTDGRGRLLDAHWQQGEPVGNDFCRRLLERDAGRRRCLGSIRELNRLARKYQPGPVPVQQSCHLGLTMLAAAVTDGPHHAGCLFCCGFSAREISRTRIGRLQAVLQQLGATMQDSSGERIPVLNREDISRLKDLLLAGAREISLARSEAQAPTTTETAQRLASGEVVARSPAMANTMEKLSRLAASTGPLLFWGPDGCGKRVLAREVHLGGGRADGRFLVLEPGADSLAVEARLFGRVRSGSMGQLGLLESARSGTVYLASGSWREAGLQVKLVRLLREGTFLPLGGNRPQTGEARLVLGLEQNPEQALAQGWLRAELAECLEGRVLRVPALSERSEDLPGLIELLWRNLAGRSHPPPKLPRETLALLRRYNWPGNGHELLAEIRSQLSLPLAEAWQPHNLSAHLRQQAAPAAGLLPEQLLRAGSLHQAIELLERQLLQAGLVRSGGNKSRLARELGISRSNLLAKLERYGLSKPRS